MKKRILIVALASLFASGAIMAQTADAPKAEKQKIDSSSSGEALFTMDYLANFWQENDGFSMGMTIGLGEYYSTSKFAWQIGAGWLANSFDYPTYTTSGSLMNKVGSIWTLRVPATLGYIIGDPDSFHIALHVGPMWSYILSVDMDGTDVDDMDRSSFSGLAKITMGYKYFSLCAEYVFPFESGSDGTWLIGISLPY